MHINYKDSYNFFLFKFFTPPIIILFYLIYSNVMVSENFNGPNFLILLLSLIIFIFSVDSIKRNGIKSYNLFSAIYFLFLLLNTFNFSDLQLPKSLTDIYYFFTGPILFSLFLYLGEKINFRKGKIVKFFPLFNIEMVVVLVWIIYLFCNIYIYMTVGFRLLSDDLLRYQDKSEYIVPGFSGLVGLTLWTLVIMIPHVKKRLSIPIIFSIILISGVLQFSRGNIFRVFLFLLLYFIITRRKDLFKRKFVIAIMVLIIVGSFLFAAFGDYRQYDSGNSFNISTLLESNIDVGVIDWIFAYSAINFDVLKLFINNNEPTYYPASILKPIERLITGNNEIELIASEVSKVSLNGFNASTFLSGFIIDFGPLYIIEVMLLGFILGVFISILNKFGYTGIYVFILTLITMTVFGNYFTSPVFLYAIVVSFLLFLFSGKENKNKNINSLKN